ncbi:hypothetical protein [Paenirhodobacter populi]|uniref:hypothetical protein n=1 Tax=Paenirhodobacter populi TaxID=2306993 RepID=UPI000FE3DB75|nr:hypothetical protein [Sinirhodobacter populi]RWR07711.1 hypothetical protein D2T32_11580 [Sinirhodobacter populi]
MTEKEQNWKKASDAAFDAAISQAEMRIAESEAHIERARNAASEPAALTDLDHASASTAAADRLMDAAEALRPSENEIGDRYADQV